MRDEGSAFCLNDTEAGAAHVAQVQDAFIGCDLAQIPPRVDDILSAAS